MTRHLENVPCSFHYQVNNVRNYLGKYKSRKRYGRWVIDGSQLVIPVHINHFRGWNVYFSPKQANLVTYF